VLLRKIEEYYKGEIKGGEFFAIAELSEPFTGALVGIFLVKEEVPMELVIIPLTLLVILMLLRIEFSLEKFIFSLVYTTRKPEDGHSRD